MNRRDFIKKTTLAGTAGLGIVQSIGKFTTAAASDVNSELIIAYDGEPEMLLQTALKKYGGLEKIVKPGSSVLLKANFSWDGKPERACNSNPALLAALVKACKKAGAKKVRVIDLAIDFYQMCLDSSGIKKAVEGAGGEVVNLLPGPVIKKTSGVLDNIAIFKLVLEAECLINVPILKHHNATQMTGALKNYMGLTSERSRMHVAGIHQAIVDLAKLIKPQLHIIDAYRVLKTNGPHGPGDVAKLKQLIITHDPVAADAYGASLLNVEPPFLKLAAEARLGQMDLSKVKITKVKC